jgi:hypothetical protein
MLPHRSISHRTLPKSLAKVFFASADAALSYGNGICDKVTQGRTYAQVMNDAKADFSTSDEYQASYLITQAVNELCPALIWQLRNSAAHYRPAPPPGDG